ncbi:MAG: MFS transporter [Gammaproteobacteria bacterium]|jgi:MFS family permease|nr:MFS transporter [Gammaproteobacteria bacterium]
MRYSWYVVFVLLLAQTFSFLDRMIMGLLVGPIRDTFQISDTQYSLLAGLAFSLFYALMGLPLARIADSRSRRNLIAAGIAVWSLMTAVCGLAKGFWMLFVARMGVGVGEATLAPGAYSMIADYFPKSLLARALSVYMVGVTLGSGFAYMLGGAVVAYVENMPQIVLPVLGAIHGWQLTFFIVGLPGLLVALLMMLTVREPPRRGLSANDVQAIALREVVDYLWSRRRAYGGHIIGVSIFIMVVYALNLWGPTYLIRTFGYTRPEAGWVFGIVMIVAGTSGLLLAGFIADSWMKRGVNDAYVRTIIVSIVGLLPCALMMGFATSDVVGIAAISLAVFFSAFQGGLSGGTLALMTPNRMRGQATAVFQLFANLIGLALGPTVVAMTTDYIFGYDAAIGKSIALCAAVLCPLGGYILWRSLAAIRTEVQAQNSVMSA